jgi:bacterioferritin
MSTDLQFLPAQTWRSIGLTSRTVFKVAAWLSPEADATSWVLRVASPFDMLPCQIPADRKEATQAVQTIAHLQPAGQMPPGMRGVDGLNSHNHTRRIIMKGSEKVIEQLNIRLAEELTATNQYMVHAEMCENWGYKKLHGLIRTRAIVEMKHAEKLIERILFLEGKPIVSRLESIHIGDEVHKMHQFDHAAEETAIHGYNESIRIAVEIGDNGTRDLLESILTQEEEHLDDIEAQLDQISQMGVQLYLSEQV